MQIDFVKYQGTGNDFILLDNRDGNIVLRQDQIAHLCDRRFGIGADGLMLLENAKGYDFRMVYYNADGSESTMCGNGGRCITAYANRLGIIGDTAKFIAIDGPHQATISNHTVALQMQDVTNIQILDGCSVLNTGSPHYVTIVNDVAHTAVFEEGRTIRNRPEYQPKGINVNFMEVKGDGLHVRTYERGVEDETLSCGTGVTACAIASTASGTGSYNITIHTPGGLLEVSFTKDSPTTANNVILKGPATFVFEGSVDV